MNPLDIFMAIAGLYRFIASLVGFGKGTLDTTQNAIDLFKTGEKLLRIGKPDEEPTDREVERARAAADLIRSFALFGLLEYLLWATKLILIVRLCALALQWLRLATRP